MHFHISSYALLSIFHHINVSGNRQKKINLENFWNNFFILIFLDRTWKLRPQWPQRHFSILGNLWGVQVFLSISGKGLPKNILGIILIRFSKTTISIRKQKTRDWNPANEASYFFEQNSLQEFYWCLFLWHFLPYSILFLAIVISRVYNHH